MGPARDCPLREVPSPAAGSTARLRLDCPARLWLVFGSTARLRLDCAFPGSTARFPRLDCLSPARLPVSGSTACLRLDCLSPEGESPETRTPRGSCDARGPRRARLGGAFRADGWIGAGCSRRSYLRLAGVCSGRRHLHQAATAILHQTTSFPGSSTIGGSHPARPRERPECSRDRHRPAGGRTTSRRCCANSLPLSNSVTSAGCGSSKPGRGARGPDGGRPAATYGSAGAVSRCGQPGLRSGSAGSGGARLASLLRLRRASGPPPPPSASRSRCAVA